MECFRVKTRSWLGRQGRKHILEFVHDSVVGGHSGIAENYQRLIHLYYWKKLRLIYAIISSNVRSIKSARVRI